MKKKGILLLLGLFLIMPKVYALQPCTPSEEYLDYMKLSEEERAKVQEPLYCKEIIDQPLYPFSTNICRASATQSKYDSRTYHYISPKVGDQGELGACWVFASIGAVESNALRRGQGYYDLSETHMLYTLSGQAYSDYAGRKGKYDIDLDYGGFYFSPATYFFNGQGQLFDDYWEYKLPLPIINSASYKQGMKLLSVGNFTLEDTNSFGTCRPSEIANIKQKIIDYGSVIGSMYMDENIFPDSGKDYYKATTGDSDSTNHAVLIVGWDDTISKNNFYNASRNGAWIVKNSWGPDWSGDGYFYISYDDNFICNRCRTFSNVSNKVTANTYKAADLVGEPYLTYYPGTQYVATTFDKQTDGNEILRKVSYSIGANMSYKVYYTPGNKNTPKSNWKLLKAGTSSTYSIDTVEVPNDIMLTNQFTIIVEFTIPDGYVSSQYMMCKSSPKNDYGTYQTGKHFYSSDLKEWLDFVSDYNCVPNIYAYTDNLNSNVVNATSISLNKTKAYLVKGKSETLTTTLNPTNVTYKTISWSSSNESVATVDPNGKVTAVAAGTATITASTPNRKSATCTVTVTNSEVNPTSVTLDKTTLSLETGASQTLKATIAPTNATNTNITWSTSNAKVATVSNGKVTAVAAGTANITAKTANGKTAVCKVTVTPKPVPVQSISFNSTTLKLEVGETGTNPVKYQPENTTEKTITWSSKDTSIATVDKNGKVTAKKVGNTVITAKAVNGKTATFTVYVVKKLPFKDVKKTDWYYDSVSYTFRENIIKGYNDTTFAPNDKVTRGQLVTILWRFEGTPSASSIKNKFSDVPNNDYFTDAVKWAESKGIIHGYNAKKFGPGDPITRQDLAVILNNYAKYKGLNATDGENISSFADYSKVKGSYSEPALKWAVKNKVMSGQNINGKKYISPGNNATRAETAAMVTNFINTFS